MRLSYLLYLTVSCTILSLSPQPILGSELAPFTSDGCSSFPNGTLKQKNLWLKCCQIHDKAYWQGGTRQQRLDSDMALKSCVANTGNPEIAKLMLTGVRVGGSPYWPTSFRWGYGWKFPKTYGKLTIEEENQIEHAWSVYLSNSDINPQK